jgi:hypothetical protein
MRDFTALPSRIDGAGTAGTRAAVLVVLLVELLISSLSYAQSPRPEQTQASKEKAAAAAPAPRHDISGTWEPAIAPGDGIQPFGAKAMPSDGKPEHQLPYTPLGLAAYKSHKALDGVDAVLPGFDNDPRGKCEPLGFPRMDLSNLRQTQILQNDYKIVILYENLQVWRVIWTDGRELPKVVDEGVLVGKEIREPRYYGYSVGKWVDDTSLVVDTVGTQGDDKTWIDLAGRPVSEALHVIERFHRVDRDRLELTVTIDDPKMYTKPWVAMDRFPFHLQDPHTDVMEMYCSPAEMEKYKKLVGDPISDTDVKPPER